MRKIKENGCKLFIGSSQINEDIRYLIRILSPDPVAVLLKKKGIDIVAPLTEAGRMKRLIKGNVYTPEELIKTCVKGKRRLSEAILFLLRRNNINKVVVSPAFPVAIADYLRKQKIKIYISEESQLKERSIKEIYEIKEIQKCQEVAVKAMKDIFRMLSESVIGENNVLIYKRKILTSEYVQKVLKKFLLDRGYWCHQVIVACGKQSANPHEQGHGPLYAYQPIVIDIFPRNLETGYWGDITRTVVKGRPPPELLNMYKAVYNIQKQILNCLKPGVKAKELHNKAIELFEKYGYKTNCLKPPFEGFIHSLGHGVGLDIHEKPYLSYSSSEKLEAGNVVTVEPALYYSDIGGVRIEDTVVITKKGYLLLVSCTKRFVIL